MRYFLFIISFFLVFQTVSANEVFLPESANPKTYQIMSRCYSHDDATFFQNWYPFWDWNDWKNSEIIGDGCFIKSQGAITYAGYWFMSHNATGTNSTTVVPDIKSFRTIPTGDSTFIGIDKTHLYIFDRAIIAPKWLDIPSVKYIQYPYFMDKKNLYFVHPIGWAIQIYKNIDISTLKTWNSQGWNKFLYDKNYFYHEEIIQEWSQISKRELKRYKNYDLATLTQTGVFLYDKNNLYSPNIPWVDIGTFQIIDETYSKDKKHIYGYDWSIIKTIYPKNSEYIGNWIFKNNGKLYQACKYEVGCDGYELKKFDVKTFRIIPTWYVDKNGYYDPYMQPITKFQAKLITYTGSSYWYFSDKIFYSNGWGEYLTLTGANIKSFMAFSGTSYAKDATSCWSEGINFSCNPKTFQSLNAWRAIDAKSVYYQNKKIKNADPKSFTGLINVGWFNWIETYHYMRDKNGVYYDERVIQNADPSTFELMKDLHAKDKKHMYYAGWKISGVDYDTYIPLRWSYGRDKNHFYFAGKILDMIWDPKEVKIVSRDSLNYLWKIQRYDCFIKEYADRCN
jgi:hypothetical protein